jgi:hypothetical protein
MRVLDADINGPFAVYQRVTFPANRVNRVSPRRAP